MVSENNMFQSCLHKVLYLSVIQWYTCFLTVFSNDASNRYLTYVCHRFAEFFGLRFASSLRNGMYRKNTIVLYIRHLKLKKVLSVCLNTFQLSQA